MGEKNKEENAGFVSWRKVKMSQEEEMHRGERDKYSQRTPKPRGGDPGSEPSIKTGASAGSGQ